MPYAGDTYSLPPGTAAVSGATADSADVNARFDDLAAAQNTARPVAGGGTGSTTASGARTNLGLVIGTDVQAYSADLATYAANPLTAGELGQLQNIGSVTISAAQWGYLGAVTAAGAALLDDADAAAQRTTLEITRGMEFIQSQDASDDATLNFTGFDASKYDAYKFVLSNVIPATDGVEFVIRTSSDGGSTWDSGASDYRFAFLAIVGSGTSIGDSIRPMLNLTLVGSDTGEDGLSGSVMVHGPHLAKKTRVEFHLGWENASGGFVVSSGAGSREASEDVDGIQFLFRSGNIESGTITMYGLRNSA